MLAIPLCQEKNDAWQCCLTEKIFCPYRKSRSFLSFFFWVRSHPLSHELYRLRLPSTALFFLTVMLNEAMKLDLMCWQVTDESLQFVLRNSCFASEVISSCMFLICYWWSTVLINSYFFFFWKWKWRECLFYMIIGIRLCVFFLLFFILNMFS